MKYVIAFIVLAILFASNPPLEEHQKEVKNKLGKIVNGALVKYSGTSNWLTDLGSMLGTNLAEGAVKENVGRKDYFFFSLTTISYNNEDNIVGVGILGKVFLSEKLQSSIEKELQKFTTGVKESVQNISGEYNNSSNDPLETTHSATAELADSSESSVNNYFRINADENNPVYFYARPDYATIKSAYFTTPEKVCALVREHDFIYIEFTNTNNQTSKGWIPLSNVQEINE